MRLCNAAALVMLLPVGCTAQSIEPSLIELPRDGWRAFGEGVVSEAADPPGWMRYGSSFNSGQYSQLRLYLRIQTGAGTVRFDEAAIGDLPLENPGFEEARGNSLVGWGQDNRGETIFPDDQTGLSGDACVRMTQAEDGVSRIWQEVECEPGMDYDASVWILTENFSGNAYAEIYGMTNGEHGDIPWQSQHISGSEGPDPGTHALAVSGRPGAVGGLEQAVEVPPGQNLVLCADLAVPLLNEGALTVSVASADDVLTEIPAIESLGRWQTHRANFQSPEDGAVTVRVTVTGDVGLVYLSNVAIATPDAAITAVGARFVSADRNLRLDEKLWYRFRGGDEDIVRNGIGILAAKLGEITRGRVSLDEGEGAPQLTVSVEGLPTDDSPWWTQESYRLRCSEAGLNITAQTGVGALYGLMAVPDLLSRAPEGGRQLIAAELNDRPAMPFRGTYMAGLPRDKGARLAWCRRLAALRINAVVIEDGIWWQLDDEDQRKAARDAFADFRDHGINPIPELQSFGWAHLVLAIDPMVAEGKLVEREELVLRGEAPTSLANANVLRTEATDIAVSSPDGNEYVEGRDYKVIDGSTVHVYRPDAKAYRVQRLPGGRIPDGATVHVSYDYVSRVNAGNCPYCPSEPRVAAIMTEAIRNTVRYLQPTTVHIGHDEPAVMNSDSRCLKREKTNAELFAEDVQRLYDAAHEVDPSVRIMLWADAVNPHHNGLFFPADPTAAAAELLPKDVILNVWFYSDDQPLTVGAESLRYFASLGLATTGSPWYSPVCSRRWGDACYASRLRGEECLGVLYTSWGGRWDALEDCARAMWRPAGSVTQIAGTGR